MISDILYEAREEILWHLTRHPATYAPWEDELHALCATMATLVEKIDNPLSEEDWRDIEEGEA